MSAPVLSVPIGPSDAFKAQMLVFLKQLLPELESLSEGNDEVDESFTFTCDITNTDIKFLNISLQNVAKAARKGYWDLIHDLNIDTKKLKVWVERTETDIGYAIGDLEDLIEELEPEEEEETLCERCEEEIPNTTEPARFKGDPYCAECFAHLRRHRAASVEAEAKEEE